jgi:hypothetical protein
MTPIKSFLVPESNLAWISDRTRTETDQIISITLADSFPLDDVADK